jgi:pyruvate/2-oxoglutarate dehydrogenase complex dihydrolipoamide acyltransferase (E2) component
MPDWNSPKSWLIIAGSVVVLGGGAWGLSSYWKSAPAGPAVPKDFSVASLKVTAAEEPGKLMDKVRESMDRDDLSEEQRRKIGENVREVWQTRMRESVDEYFNASDEEKNAVLDRHLEEFQKAMQAMEERRKEWEKERENDKDGERERRGRGMFGPQTQEERKAQSESRNPDQMARAMAYFAAVQKRAQERGMKLPQGGPGRGRGPGGRGP